MSTLHSIRGRRATGFPEKDGRQKGGESAYLLAPLCQRNCRLTDAAWRLEACLETRGARSSRRLLLLTWLFLQAPCLTCYYIVCITCLVSWNYKEINIRYVYSCRQQPRTDSGRGAAEGQKTRTEIDRKHENPTIRPWWVEARYLNLAWRKRLPWTPPRAVRPPLFSLAQTSLGPLQPRPDSASPPLTPVTAAPLAPSLAGTHDNTFDSGREA